MVYDVWPSHYSTMNSYSQHHQRSPSCSSSPSPPSSSKRVQMTRWIDSTYGSPSTSASNSFGAVYDRDELDYQLDEPRLLSRKRQRDQWQWASDDDDDESDNGDDDDIYSCHCQSQHRRPASPPRSLPALSTSPSPSSIDSVETWLSVSERSSCGSTTLDSQQRSRHSSRFSRKSTSTTITDADASPELPCPKHAAFASSPTTKEMLRKEWLSLSLTLSIGMFRIKRRVKGVISRS